MPAIRRTLSFALVASLAMAMMPVPHGDAATADGATLLSARPGVSVAGGVYVASGKVSGRCLIGAVAGVGRPGSSAFRLCTWYWVSSGEPGRTAGILVINNCGSGSSCMAFGPLVHTPVEWAFGGPVIPIIFVPMFPIPVASCAADGPCGVADAAFAISSGHARGTISFAAVRGVGT